MNVYLKSMSVRDKAAQMIFPRFSFADPDYESVRDLIRSGIGGLLLQKGSVFDVAPVMNSFQRLAKLPLLACADLEDGAGGMIDGATALPSNMAVGATQSEEHARRKGIITAAEARCMGIHLVLAPVMDVNTCADNPIINTRAFGGDPDLVSRMGLAFMEGCRQEHVLTSVKHFPGHGATSVDSHLTLPVLEKSMDDLEAVELRPFRAAVSAADSVMTAHLSVPMLDGPVPASVSEKITGELLREKLGYAGLVITDALMMGGVAGQFSEEEVLVRAVRAGADVLLYPREPLHALDVLEQAVRRGDISMTMIDQAVERILDLKERQGLFQNRIAPVETIEEVLHRPRHREWARAMAEDSVTLIRDRDGILPLPGGGQPVFILAVPADGSGNVTVLEQTLKAAGVEVRRGAPDRSEACCIVVIAKKPRGFQDSVSMTAAEIATVRKVAETTKKMIIVSLGSPYVVTSFDGIGCAVCVYSDCALSQEATARALLGQISMKGRLPVTL